MGRARGGGTWGGGASRGRARPQLRPGTHGRHLPSRLNGSSLENDAFSDKSERELAQESDDEAQDHSRKTNESGSDRSEAPGGPAPRGTTYVEQVHEELGEVRAPPAWRPGVPLRLAPTPEAAVSPGRELEGQAGPWGLGDRGIRVAPRKRARWAARLARSDGKATGGFWVGRGGVCRGPGEAPGGPKGRGRSQGNYRWE